MSIIDQSVDGAIRPSSVLRPSSLEAASNITDNAVVRAGKGADAPIGVFDSGVGGLTVVGALLRRSPSERVLYLADQAHVPYGGRPLEEIRELATGISRFLAEQGCRAVVMACNISSAVALPGVREMLAPLPVFGMIGPAARRATERPGGRIGVLATAGTVQSGAYTAHIRALDPAAQVVEVACPRFVPLVEAGRLDTEDAEAAAREYLSPLAEAGCETVILGCTHYPFLLPALEREARDLWSGPVRFVDPASAVVEDLRDAVPASISQSAHSVLLTTGDRALFADQAPRFLPGVDAEIGTANWVAGMLHKMHMPV